MTDTPNDAEFNESSASASPVPGLRGLLRNPKAQWWIGVALIVIVGIAAYQNTVRVPLQWDEEQAVAALLSASPSAYLDRLTPLARVLVGLDARWSGLSALGFRVTSVFIHLLSAILLFAVARRLLADRPRGALIATLAGLAFIAHPGATQAVNSIFGRGALVCGLFSIAALAAYLRSTTETSDTRRRAATYYAGALVLSALAWSAHSMACVLPLVFLTADIVRGETFRVRRLAPVVALFAILIGVHLSGVAVVTAPPGEGARWLGDAPNALAHFRTLFAPMNLFVYYPPEAQGGVWLCIAALVTGVALLRFVPIAGFAVLWIAATIYASGIFSHTPGYDEATTYLAIAGLALFAAGIAAASSRPIMQSIAAAAIGLIVLGATAATATRNNTWRSEAQLWIEAQEACPTCYEPARRLGTLHLREASRLLTSRGIVGPSDEDRQTARGHAELALSMFDDATAHPEADAGLYVARAQALQLLDKTDAAEASLLEALRKDPLHRDALLALGTMYARRSDQGDRRAAAVALRYLDAAASTEPLAEEAEQQRGILRFRHGDALGAIAGLQPLVAATDSGPVNQVYNAALDQLRSVDAIQRVVAQGVAQAPGANAALKAQLLFIEGHDGLAGAVSSDAFRNYPDSVEAWSMLGVVAAREGRLDDFLKRFSGPDDTDPETATQALARALAGTGQWPAASRLYLQQYPDDRTGAAIALAELAVSLGQTQRAMEYLNQVAQADATDPRPWMKMAELALAAGQRDAARRMLAAAESRGADPIILNMVREQGGLNEPGQVQLERSTIIR